MIKHLLSTLALSTLIAPCLHATTCETDAPWELDAPIALTWKTDVPTALEQAAQQEKYVLLLFTGSDWCGSCIAMKKHVLSTPEFAAYAQEHFVLVELDFPRKPLPPVLATANRAQQQKYQVQRLPTLLVLSPEGVVIGAHVGSTGRLDDLKEAFAQVTEPSEELSEVLGNLSAESAAAREEAFDTLFFELLPVELQDYNEFLDEQREALEVEVMAELEEQEEQEEQQQKQGQEVQQKRQQRQGQQDVMKLVSESTPLDAAVSEDDVQAHLDAIEEIGEDYHALLEYTDKHISSGKLSRAAEFLLYAQQVEALVHVIQTEEEVQHLYTMIVERIVPDFQNDYPEEMEELSELAEMLTDPELVQELLEENKAR